MGKQELSKRQNAVSKRKGSKPKTSAGIVLIATTTPGQARHISHVIAQFVKKHFPNFTVTTITGSSKELLGGVISSKQKSLPENKRKGNARR